MISDTGCISGIYKIENVVNGKCYVGSAVDLKNRWSCHRKNLKRKNHNKKLQNAWDKYGEKSFIFSVIEYVEDVSELIGREQYWIDILDAVKNGYNVRIKAESNLGVIHTSEARQNMGAARRGAKHAEETKQRISATQKGISKPCTHEATQETREKISRGNTGKVRTPEQRQHLSTIRKGAKQTPEVIAAVKAGKEAARKKRLAEGLPERAARKPLTEAQKKACKDKRDQKKANGYIHPLTGRKKSEAHIEAIQIAAVKREVKRKEAGVPSPIKGVPKTQEHRDKISQTLKACAAKKAATTHV